ncbi:histidine kinase dimerization/phospho-acceptor domain-containing protein, partial [Acinetobacter baumannii]
MQPALNAFPEQPADTAEATSRAGLEQAFALFNQMSSQLSESYSLLEERVTELKGQLALVSAQRMEELAEKERLANRLQSLLDLLPGGVIVIDAHGVVREANPAALGLLGEPLVGMLWREVIARCFAPREDDGHEISLRDGRRLSIATRSLNGEPGQLILLNDLTDTRRLQEQLARHERLSALGRMVASLAHQIRTPLSAALLYAGHLSEQALPTDQQQRFAGRLKERLHELEHQVRDMLVFARGELPLTDRVAPKALFDSLLVFENYPVAEALEKGSPGGVRFGPVSNHEQTNYPLTVALGVGDSLSLQYSYDRQAFSDAAVEQLDRHLLNLLEGFVDNAERTLV